MRHDFLWRGERTRRGGTENDVNDPKAALGEGVNSTRVKLGGAFGLPTTIFVIP